jgi:hypothetical protein
MRVRRCAILWLEPREVAHFELEDLLSGGTGVISEVRWFAHAPHLDDAVEIDASAAELLGRVSPADWQPTSVFANDDESRVRTLLAQGLLISDEDASGHSERDATYRAQHWFGLSSLWHVASRWRGLDAAGEVKMVSAREEEGLTLLSTWAGKPQPDWKMRISMKTPKNIVRYAFALSDVPLP